MTFASSFQDAGRHAGRYLIVLAMFCAHATPYCPGAELTSEKWELTPYRVRVVVAVQSVGMPQGEIERALVQSLAARIDSGIGLSWNAQVTAPQSASERAFCLHPGAEAKDPLAIDDDWQDAGLWLSVVESPLGFSLNCREYNAFFKRWEPSHSAKVAQRSFLAEACFQLLQTSFAPIAKVTMPAGDAAKVQAVFKGGALSRRTQTEAPQHRGDALLPLWRRVDRRGKVSESPAETLPWTFLVLDEPQKSGWLANVVSSQRTPYAAQRRNAAEQYALALRGRPEPIVVHFYSKQNRDEPFRGYEVYRAVDAKTSPQKIGITDERGEAWIPAGPSATSMLLLRSEGRLLAKVPIAKGLPEPVEVPVVDDASRVRADVESAMVREELIDVVARRAILSARIRNLLKKGRVKEATGLMEELSDLPTTSVFAASIASAQRRIAASANPAIQKAIDAQFADVRALLGKYLDSKAITDLQYEVNQAKEGPVSVLSTPAVENGS